MQNDVWDILPRLEGKSVVSSRWLYKIKHTKHVADGSIEKFKERFVVRGFSPERRIVLGDICSSCQVHFH
jgi:hypothetical protein